MFIIESPRAGFGVTITLSEAQSMIQKAEKKARELKIKVSIYVVDAVGEPVAFYRMDGAATLTPDIARAKAYTAATFRENTKDLADPPLEATSLIAVSGGRIVYLPGGVMAKRDGELIGAIGISGATGDQDHECALAATSS
jgi:uncharacterized protein GlcG (DUF336 family)